METLQKQTLEATAEQLTFFPVASRNHANHSVTQGSNGVNQTSDIYLKKCLEQYEKLNPDGLWQKMFVQLLHQNLSQYSTKYAHRWSLRGTKFHRYLFLLRRLGQNTKGTGFGLLPTPNAEDCRDRGNLEMKAIIRRQEIGKQVGLSAYFKGSPCPICLSMIMGFPKDWLTKPFQNTENQPIG